LTRKVTAKIYRHKTDFPEYEDAKRELETKERMLGQWPE